jgi:hypothetical protein
VPEREVGEYEDRRIAFRIGINIGDIILEDGDIYGDGVNVAARLEGLAEAGGICLARSVYNQVKGKLAVSFEPMGKHQVKNIAEPVETFRVALDGVAPAQTAIGPESVGDTLGGTRTRRTPRARGRRRDLAPLARRPSARGQTRHSCAAVRQSGRG